MRIAPLPLVMILFGLVIATACKSRQDPSGPGSAVAQPSAGATPEPPDETGRIDRACQGSEAKGPLEWFANDYAAALACARARNKPLFIDFWAPWCHTCLSMKHTVLMDPGIAPLADRFVWVELDTDREETAALLTRLPVRVWPTFYVIAPADESVQARYLGAASVAQLRDFLLQGEKGFLAATSDSLPRDSPLRAVRDGDQAVARGDLDAAATAYAMALSRAPADWSRRPDVLVSLISAHAQAHAWDKCVALASAEMANTGASASTADFIYVATSCAGKLPGDRSNALIAIAATRLEGLIEDAGAPLSVDDRADAMRILRELELERGNQDRAAVLAQQQRALLDKAAAEAPTAFAAMTYNWPRAEVYVFLGKAAELIPALEKSIADLPNEYDPPYRLAWIHEQLGNHDRALPYAQQALGLVYGPRKARVQSLIIDIHVARKDKAAERAARQTLIAIYESLPEGQQQPDALLAAHAALAAMDESN